MKYYWGVRLLAGCLLVAISQAAPPGAAPNVMALQDPDISMSLRAVKHNDPGLSAYLSDPKSVCTFFVPDNKAMADWMKWFGKYAGKAVQNTTFMHSALNYHVVPGRALTAKQLGEPSKLLTRANETLYFWRQGGEPHVYSRPDHPVGLVKTDVKAGNCIVHTVNKALVPPTSSDMVQAWVDEIGLMPQPPPKSQWAPPQQPLPNSLEAAKPATAAASSDTAVSATPAGGRPSSSSADAALTGTMALAVGVLAVLLL